MSDTQSEVLSAAQLRNWILRYADRIDENAAWLTQLDAAIGDADHGSNMVRGMQRVRVRLQEPDAARMDCVTLFRTVAMTLISNVGGAAGPLYGAFFLRASKEIAPPHVEGQEPAARVESLNSPQLAQAFHAGVDGLRQRGKVEPGEKTILDTLLPAEEALREAVDNGKPLTEAITRAREAAQKGMESTIPLEATKGRASYLGMRSIGHQDPGATSACLLITTLWEEVAAGEHARQARVALEKKDHY